MVIRSFILIFLFIQGAYSLRSQYDNTIVLRNPSFEGLPHKGGDPRTDFGIRGWYDCGELQFPAETAADLHPIDAWRVNLLPSEGRTYLGLVVRDNDSWESISQRIEAPIQEGQCYEFTVDMARSPYYVSHSRITEKVENYTEPAVLRIWGGTGVCGRQELIGESSVVNNNQWKTFQFDIKPGRTLNYMTLEAFYEVPVLIPYNGHLLVDNASAIKQVPCPGDNPLLVEKISLPKQPNNDAGQRPVAAKEEIASVQEPMVIAEEIDTPVKKNKLLEDLDAMTVKKGQIIRIENLYFAANSSKIQQGSDDVLQEIYDFLKDNRNILVEIGGHTNTIPLAADCDRLSANRAKQVALYLTRKGISPKRLRYRGYGKRKPIVANDKFDMEARKKNQRVEIKILSLNYSEATGSISKPNDLRSSQKDG